MALRVQECKKTAEYMFVAGVEENWIRPNLDKWITFSSLREINYVHHDGTLFQK
jgi:hypothetical protein